VPSALVALAFVLSAPSAYGQEQTADASQSQNPPAWAKSPLSIQLTTYLWAASMSGDVGVRGLPPVGIDVDFDEIFKSIDWFPPPLMLAAEVRYDRVGFLSDFIYLGLDGDGASPGPLPLTADANLKTLIFTAGGSYRVLQSDSVDLDLLAGARLWMLDANLTLTGPLAVRQGGRSEAWVDPIVGVATHIKLGGGFGFKAEGDVGGFGVGSDLDWQVLGALQYQLNDSITLEAGYRYLSVDYDKDGFLFDMAMQGPIIGGSIRF
jgi:opacity protein-like surface antigen